MFLVVVHHGIVHGFGLASISSLYSESDCDISIDNYGELCYINSFCIIAVNVFIILSGYFGIKASVYKFVSLFVAILFYTLIFTVGYYFYSNNYSYAINTLKHPLVATNYWFVIDYIFLMIFTPAINMYFDSISRIKMFLFVISIVFVDVYFGFLYGHSISVDGYTFFHFIVMYSIGRLIGINKFKINCLVSVILYIIASFCIAYYMTTKIKLGEPEIAWKITYYNNPVVILSSICFFYIFNSYKLKINHSINKIAKSSLAIYLFQCSGLVSTVYYSTLRNYSGVHPFIILTKYSVCIIIIALMIDKVHIWINNYITETIVNIYCKNKELWIKKS